VPVKEGHVVLPAWSGEREERGRRAVSQTKAAIASLWMSASLETCRQPVDSIQSRAPHRQRLPSPPCHERTHARPRQITHTHLIQSTKRSS
jgi:hypothetical protein